MPKFSILIPAYKSLYLEECILSILSQTFRDYEIVILNDCSPEDLNAIISKFQDPHIIYNKNDHNVGAKDVVKNWNRLLKLAKGEFVICIGDDDKLLPNCLEEYNKLIDKHPNLDIYHAWTEIIDESSKPYAIQAPRPEYEGMFSMIWNRWHGRLQYVGDFCFRRKSLIDMGGFVYLPYAWGSDDITSYLMCGSKGVANSQIPMFQYRENRQSISSTGDIRGKLEATLDEITKTKEIMTFPAQNQTEELFKAMVLANFDTHFRRKIQTAIVDDITNRGIGAIGHWIKKRKVFGLSLSNIVWIAILSMKEGANKKTH